MDRIIGRVVNSKLVILESNWDVQEIYKENEPNSFVTKFFDPLVFDGSWEVAISEISYPLYLQNYSKTDLVVMEWKKLGDVRMDPVAARKIIEMTEYDVSIPAGYYSSPQKLGDRFITEFIAAKRIRKPKEEPKDLFFEYNFKTARSTFIAKDHNYAITSDGPEPSLFFPALGFTASESKVMKPLPWSRDVKEHISVQHNSSKTAPLPPKLTTYHMMKIYLDCIEDTIVGNTLTHELATVTIPDGQEGQIFASFGNLNYVPLNKTKLETIKMECRDTEGQLFPLYGGHVHASFHFRRCQLTL